MNSATLYRWTDLPTDKPMPLIDRQRVMAEKMMVSKLLLHRGFTVPVHVHENEQITIVMHGKLRFQIQDEPDDTFRIMEVGAGEVIVLPSLVPHGATAIEECIVFDIFSPPSQGTGVDQPARA